jgi:hypothetical protein
MGLLKIYTTATIFFVVFVAHGYVFVVVCRPYSACHNYTGGGSKCEDFLLATPGAAKHEMEQFRRMEMVDMVITRIWFSSRKSRIETIFSSDRFWDFAGISPPGQPSRQDETTPRGRFVNFTLRGLL